MQRCVRVLACYVSTALLAGKINNRRRSRIEYFQELIEAVKTSISFHGQPRRGPRDLHVLSAKLGVHITYAEAMLAG